MSLFVRSFPVGYESPHRLAFLVHELRIPSVAFGVRGPLRARTACVLADVAMSIGFGVAEVHVLLPGFQAPSAVRIRMIRRYGASAADAVADDPLLNIFLCQMVHRDEQRLLPDDPADGLVYVLDIPFPVLLDGQIDQTDGFIQQVLELSPPILHPGDHPQLFVVHLGELIEVHGGHDRCLFVEYELRVEVPDISDVAVREGFQPIHGVPVQIGFAVDHGELHVAFEGDLDGCAHLLVYLQEG